jgi:hypothetical protein
VRTGAGPRASRTGSATTGGETLRCRGGTRLRDEEGAAAAEHIGVVVVVGAVVAALVALSLGPTLAAWGGYAVCSLFGSGVCDRPGSLDVDAAAEDDGPTGDLQLCAVSSSRSGIEASIDILWASAAGAEGYDLVRSSDGTTTVTYDREVGFGANANTGGGLNLHFGEESFNLELSAGATGLWTMTGGETLTFPSPEAAQQFVDWHRAIGSAPDRYDHLHPVEYINPLNWGGSSGVGARIDGWAANAGNSIAGLWGGGVDDPPAPTTTIVHHAGGWDIDASAQWGFATAEVGGSVSTTGQIGWSEDTSTGERIYYYEASNDLLLQAGFAQDAARAETGLSGNSLIAVSVDANGRTTGVAVTTHTIADPGMDPSRLDDPRELLGNDAFARAGDGIATSLYEITMSMPVDGSVSTGEIVGNLLHGGGGGQLTGDLWSDGEVHMVEYGVTDRRGGLDVGLGIVGIGGGGGAATVSSDREANAAHFLSNPGGDDRAWLPSTSCVVPS